MTGRVLIVAGVLVAIAYGAAVVVIAELDRTIRGWLGA